MGSDESKARFLACSVSLGTMINIDTFAEEWKASKDVALKVDYQYRKCTLFFQHLTTDYKMDYKIKDLVNNSIIVEKEGHITNFTTPLRYPGRFWRRIESSNNLPDSHDWKRVTLIPLTSNSDITSRSTNPILSQSRKDIVKIGDWIVFRLHFDLTVCPQPSFAQKIKQAASFKLVPDDLKYCRPTITVADASTLCRPYDYNERTKNWNFDFDVLYMLESCISYHIFNLYNLDKTFFDTVANFNAEYAVSILEIIFQMQEPVYKPLEKWWDIWIKMQNMIKSNENTIPKHCAMIRKVIISPTHIYYHPPILETTNRITRQFKEHIDSFMRIQFIDEHFNKVDGTGTGDPYIGSNSLINQRIYDVLKHGVQIGNRKFEFLAYSSSQLRYQGCWFVAPSTELTPHMIRDWMGDFSQEKIVAKNAARMDVFRGRYTFSDGVGRMSPVFAEQAAKLLELSSVPCAFQFRLGCARGVLTLSKELENTDVKIQLRPSQIKFKSNHMTVEVIRVSTYNHSSLNRQSITLLSTLGVKDEVFMELMQEMIQDLNHTLENTPDAIQALAAYNNPTGTTQALISILQAGFLDKRDPFIKNLLNLFRIKILKELKKKAKIVISKGAYLLGVMDETDTLKEGEVFVQTCDTSYNGEGRQIITGDVVVYRNPCVHPGDIRTLTAVNAEQLHYLTNVIVFPQKGYRDIPSMCSGEDLDGDDYTVCWDPRLIPPVNHAPMDYTSQTASKGADVQIEDIIKFYVSYIDNDVLGQIANAHLAVADNSLLGAEGYRCISLAHLHSTAVDFGKTGIPAILDRKYRADSFPDFMEKKDKPMYISTKALDKIFRKIDKADYKNYQSMQIDENVFDKRLIVPDMEIYIDEARVLKSQYGWQMFAHMNHFGIQTEEELFSGFVVKWLNKKNGNSKTENQQQHVKKAIEAFKASWKKRFEEEFLDPSGCVDLTRKHHIDAKAAAWYYVAYDAEERSRNTLKEYASFSFPWCIHEYICDIVKTNWPKHTVNYPTVSQEKIEGIRRLEIVKNEEIGR